MKKNKPVKGNPKQVNCPPTGDATDPVKQREDMLKNRGKAPAKTNNQITLAKLVAPLMAGENDDLHRWSENDGATISGYFVDAHYGSAESCNCHSNATNMWDIHVELVADLADEGNHRKYLIAELTRNFPQLRTKWTPDTLKNQFQGKRITVTGWMFFDPDHKNESENTNPGGHHNWRATAWEIHPITSIS
jgi:hypothetical protein